MDSTRYRRDKGVALLALNSGCILGFGREQTAGSPNGADEYGPCHRKIARLVRTASLCPACFGGCASDRVLDHRNYPGEMGAQCTGRHVVGACCISHAGLLFRDPHSVVPSRGSPYQYTNSRGQLELNLGDSRDWGSACGELLAPAYCRAALKAQG